MADMKELIKKWDGFKKNLTKEVSSLFHERNWSKIKKQVDQLISSAKKEVHSFVDEDLTAISKKLKNEKDQLEKLLDSTFKYELDKAKKFVNERKKELNQLQKTIESLAKKPSKKKKVSKKKSKKKATKKKASKK